MDILLAVLLAITLIGVAFLIFLIIKGKGSGLDANTIKELQRLKQELLDLEQESNKQLAYSLQREIKLLGEMISFNQKQTDEYQSKKFEQIERNILQKQESLNKSVINLMTQFETRFKTFEAGNEQKLDAMRTTIEKRLNYIQEDNNKKLDEMRQTVDEKLQKTLEEKMTMSFKLVNERLEQVYKGLGEMRNLASGVSDLKKVLSNVKTRGILGEVQLKAILEEILSSEQYEENIATKPKSSERVEFAIKLPGDETQNVYMPIDSKFPMDAYADLQEAYQRGDKGEIDVKFSVLASRIKRSAKDIHDKYIEPPYTTEFAIMFLPFEGLYAEVVNRGLVEILQRDYHVNIAGPSTMAALLNSIQMGFKTIAIQKRSSEVWKTLGAVRSEFDKFGSILEDTQTKLEQANDRLDKLVGVRTRAIQRKLRNVDRLNEGEVIEALEE